MVSGAGERCRFGAVWPGTAALLMSVAACATVPAEQALDGISTPPSWTALTDDAPAQAVTENWLADLGDARADAVVAEALARNKDLENSASQVGAILANARVTRASLLPQAQFGFTASSVRTPAGDPQFNPETGEFEGGGEASSSDSYRLSTSLSWELDVWGRLTDQTRAAYLDVEAARLDFAAAQLSLAGAAVQGLYGLTAATLQRQLSERDVETGENNLRVIERRYERGISTSLDVRLARSSLAQSRANLAQRRQTEIAAARRLETLLGRYPAGQMQGLGTLPGLPTILDEDGAITGVGEPGWLLVRRPDILAAEADIEASGLRVAAARKAFLPSLSLSASAQSLVADSYDDVSYDPDDLIANLVGNLVQPLFQGGRLRANEKAREFQLKSSLAQYGQTVLSAYEEVENALTAEHLLSTQYTAQALALEEAKAAEALTVRQYLAGTATIFDLINAQQRAISSESQFITAAEARLSNRIDLYLALGAPFHPQTDPDLIAFDQPIGSSKEGS
ncbi:Outer membrane efflux protein [Parvularcula bermudensis HTCC2503]|uniref:Outer membrane efflux protein n=2 Tax=Parvularcula TaxID=208215 RepID=E0TBA9_PARBH|nr:Outer membrane efflux protein [Parvularcula bermudensis HTCC2503]